MLNYDSSESQKAEHQRWYNHIEVNVDDFGSGKQEKKTTSYLFCSCKWRFNGKWQIWFFSWGTERIQTIRKDKYAWKVFHRFCVCSIKIIKKYDREAELSLIAEFKQLMGYNTFHGRKAGDLSYEQKKSAINMINLIQEKLIRGQTPENPLIHARSCLNGRAQRGLCTKEEITPLTVSQDAFLWQVS